MDWPNSLPIDPFIPEILNKISKNTNVILQSGPGTGKTTRIPLAVYPQLPKESGKVLVLVPRRLAAKMAALRLAETLGEKVGETVGYAFRSERVEGPSTKILVITEGTFIKIAERNPELLGIGMVILDEFHERHSATDLALILIQDIQSKKRPDLKTLIMSATIDCQKLLSVMGGQKSDVMEIPVKSYPVELKNFPHRPEFLKMDMAKKVYEALHQLIEHPGDILVFLPGMKEILATKSYLAERVSHEFEILILHGDLSKDEQFNVMRPSRAGFRKIILSTNIAESSVTIPGVRLVIDSGLKRELHFSPWSGVAKLETKKISQFSAIQRAGRAGREATGIAFRLYSAEEFKLFQQADVPEILRSDLSLELLALISRDLDPFKVNWPDAPAKELIQRSIDCLLMLGAVLKSDTKLRITEIGKRIFELPLSPREARAILELIDKAPLDAPLILKAMLKELDERDFKIVSTTERYLKDNIKNINPKSEKSPFFYLIYGFIDKLAKLRFDKKDFITQDGQSLKCSYDFAPYLENHPLWLILDTGANAEVTKAVPVEELWIYEFEELFIRENEECHFNEQKKRLEIVRKTSFGQIVLEEDISSFDSLSSDQKLKYSEQLFNLKKKAWDKIWKEFLETSEYARFHFIISDSELNLKLDFENVLNSPELVDLPEITFGIIASQIEQLMLLNNPNLNLNNLDKLYPTKISLKDKKQLKIIYSLERGPIVEAMIQEFYGTTDLPMIGEKKIKLTVSLLGPHKRPLQVTSDLKGFWQKGYKEMYRELSREYPKHHWPIEPEKAPPIIFKKFLNDKKA